MLAPDASKHLSRQEMQFAERAIAEYNALPYAERSNDPSTRQAITIPTSTIMRQYAPGCAVYADQAYFECSKSMKGITYATTFSFYSFGNDVLAPWWNALCL